MNFDEFRLVRLCRYQNWPTFWNSMHIWQFCGQKKIEQFFSCIFMGITHMKVRNPLILGKMASDRQFLTKIHKVGLVWSLTLVSIDKITKNTKFQTFIVVQILICGSWARIRQPLEELFTKWNFPPKFWIFFPWFDAHFKFRLILNTLIFGTSSPCFHVV